LVKHWHGVRVHEPGDAGVAGGHLDEDVALELGVGRTPARAADLLEQLVASRNLPENHPGYVPHLCVR
jgi:hypothetical protein